MPMLKRVSLALETGAVVLPVGGQILVIDPDGPPGLPDLPPARVDVVTRSAQVKSACAAAGHRVVEAPLGGYGAVLVCLSRARPLARLRIAEAAAAVVPDGLVLVDGAKADGIESALKDCKARAEIRDSYVKSHGRLFWFSDGDFVDWARIAADWPAVEGFQTAPGIFSADGIDPGSALLAAHLPRDLAGYGADLGAGWGYLARQTLTRPKVKALHLVEDDRAALAAAEANLEDPRAQFHWADALRWQAPGLLDFVVTNPPFHRGRAADPGLGQGFIEAAARMLSRRGVLWLVANRHLPYEQMLEARFHDVTEVIAATGYKVIRAEAPRSAETRKR